ncbi:MAG: iron dependent repressor, metal binding and dimerization domain protein, partial [Nitrospinota bacterium]|nr:iron dependent repressor, metal binding and dimerization domain protein [Nitrospinota bacterium]
GLFWRGLLAARASSRVLIEDALKHIYDCEYRRISCTIHSVSGALGISANRAAGLLARLRELELVSLLAGGYRLTPEGRSYSLRIIRIHRLWERYLSDQTSLAAAEWHNEAEQREHKISPAEAEALAARMGHPSFDPHGDPIPSARGDIPPPKGRPLTELSVGEVAEIVHLEDEPDAVHAQLVAENLHPGMRVRVVEISPRRVRFEAGAEEHVLGPVVDENLSVVLVPGEEGLGDPSERLSSLQTGEKAEVTGISSICRGPERRRMLDLGLLPGTIVKAEFTSPSGDPTAYRIRGSAIALRKEQADLIHIHLLGNGDSP